VTQTKRSWPCSATLWKAHDGDSFWPLLDTGFDHADHPELRLRRVYAPETSEAGNAECVAFINSWFHDQLRFGVRFPCEVDTFKTSGDNDVRTLARYVAEVRGADGSSLNEALINYIAAHPEWPRGIGS
jgi:hypothetical protein